VNFANVVTSQAVKGRYSAGGVQAVTRQFVSQQGLIQSATSPTDLGISGDGFFIATTKGPNLTAADQRVFTRSGAFSVDADGYLVNDAKLYLQGWPIKADGSFDFNPSDLNSLQSINVKNLGSVVRPTSDVVITANLNKTQTVSAGEATYDPAAKSMAEWATDPNPANATQPDFKYEMSIVDSAGATHKIAVAFLKDSGAPNLWHAEIYSIPATDVQSAAGNGQIAAGKVAFTADGQFDLANTTLFGAAGSAPRIVLGDSAAGAQPKWDTALGINGSDITLNWDKFTQLDKSSALTSANSNGATVGNVVGVEVGEDGIVSAIYDNSEVRQIAKIGLATFPNPDGLMAVSGNAYRPTIPSGEFVIKEPGAAGAGLIAPGTLEASTVDLSAEFTGLITTQKAYSASSKIITTADQMLDELINIKR
jgi:flagellar hook protein FlgE